MATDGVGGATVTRQAGGWVIPMEQPGSEISIRVGLRRVTLKILNYIDRKSLIYNRKKKNKNKNKKTSLSTSILLEQFWSIIANIHAAHI